VFVSPLSAFFIRFVLAVALKSLRYEWPWTWGHHDLGLDLDDAGLVNITDNRPLKHKPKVIVLVVVVHYWQCVRWSLDTAWYWIVSFDMEKWPNKYVDSDSGRIAGQDYVNTVEKQFRVKIYTQCKIYTQYKKNLKCKTSTDPKILGSWA